MCHGTTTADVLGSRATLIFGPRGSPALLLSDLAALVRNDGSFAVLFEYERRSFHERQMGEAQRRKLAEGKARGFFSQFTGGVGEN